MDNDSWSLATTTYGQLADRRFDLAILPWAATEPHNYHLPFGTDVIETDRIADCACRTAVQEGANLVRLATIPFGTQTTQQALPFAVNLNPTTQLAILTDVCETLVNSGVPKLVILNGHGGNDFAWMIRELYGSLDLFIAAVNWYELGDLSIFESPGDHAGEMETSLCLHLIPELVAPLTDAGDGAAAAFAIDLFNTGKAKTSRPWDRLTRSSGVGDPRPATADKGKRFFEQVTRELATFFVQLARAPMDEHFPFSGPPPATDA
jgi:creatinine amidohydrolase